MLYLYEKGIFMNLETQYNNIAISYNEFTNCWEFEFNGKMHSVSSLSEAKKTIDTPPRKKFIPISVLYGNWENEYLPARVTSWSTSRARITFTKDKSRREVRMNDLFEDTAENKILIDRIHSLHLAKDKIDARITECKTMMTRVVFKEEK